MKSYSMIYAVFMFSFVHDFNTFAFVYYLFQLFCLPNILISPCINLSRKQGPLNRFEGRSSACEWSN